MAYKKLKYWFDKDLAELIGKKVCKVKPQFDIKAFSKNVEKRVINLELKDRVEVIADELYQVLDEEYKMGISLLIKILGPENKEETGMFTNYYWVMPISKYIEKYGLNDFKTSMKAIEEITKRNTGEYAIRPFLERERNKTLEHLNKWSLDTNNHVRRLSSEGARPRLPWAKKLDVFINDPTPLIPILNNLKDDKSKYVQKSVANCINDVMKDNPEIAKKLLEDWNIKGISKERKWIIKHALRNLLKREDRWAQQMTN